MPELCPELRVFSLQSPFRILLGLTISFEVNIAVTGDKGVPVH
jgi:hypothetical protein